MNPDIQSYNDQQTPAEKAICDLLATAINKELTEAENKIWHAHPVWFLDGNPVVGYSKLKSCIRLLFWSGQTFEEEKLQVEGKFKAAERLYRDSKVCCVLFGDEDACRLEVADGLLTA